jgi:ribosomal protein L11 methyltransferase
VIWPLRPDDERIELLLAEVDDESPVAIEQRPNGVRVFFSSAAARGRAGTRLAAVAPELTCEPIDVPDEQWAERSQASLGAVEVGRFVVAPPWVDTGASGDRIVIQPSMGFGTAHHASTRLCLRLLQSLAVSGSAVLDVGTGSGVLAIAAWKLGAVPVAAVDHDPDALTSARENVALNGAREAIAIQELDLAGDMAAMQGGFDIVLANLTGAVLIRYARQLAACVRPGGGGLITSGYGPDEERAVADAFARERFVQLARAEEPEWVGACFQRPSPPPERS